VSQSPGGWGRRGGCFYYPPNLIGQVVDVFGRRTYCGMMGDPSHFITRIALAEDDACGPVPVQTTDWGALKAMYR